MNVTCGKRSFEEDLLQHKIQFYCHRSPYAFILTRNKVINVLMCISFSHTNCYEQCQFKSFMICIFLCIMRLPNITHYFMLALEETLY